MYSPDDIFRCFMQTAIDFLVINDYLYDKKLQPEWKDPENWSKEFALD